MNSSFQFTPHFVVAALSTLLVLQALEAQSAQETLTLAPAFARHSVTPRPALLHAYRDRRRRGVIVIQLTRHFKVHRLMSWP
jgi:hypothetical protein